MKGDSKMTNQQRLMLATLKGRVDGKVTVAKCIVRAACVGRGDEKAPYHKGYRDGNLRQAVQALRDMRDVQRHVNEYCKGVGYD